MAINDIVEFVLEYNLNCSQRIGYHISILKMLVFFVAHKRRHANTYFLNALSLLKFVRVLRTGWVLEELWLPFSVHWSGWRKKLEELSGIARLRGSCWLQSYAIFGWQEMWELFRISDRTCIALLEESKHIYTKLCFLYIRMFWFNLSLWH